MIVKIPIVLGTIGSAASMMQAKPDDELLGWAIRLVLAGLVAVGGWVLRDAAKTLKDTHKEVAVIKSRLDTHDIMFEHWVSEMVERGLPPSDAVNPGRRKSDKVMRDLIRTRIREE